MRGYDISFDTTRSVLACRISPALRDSEVGSLLADLDKALRAAREHGSIRLLWDNRANRVFSPDDARSLKEVTAKHARAGDRTAILVSGNAAKAQARGKSPEGSSLFASQNAAYLWLSVGRG